MKLSKVMLNRMITKILSQLSIITLLIGSAFAEVGSRAPSQSAPAAQASAANSQSAPAATEANKTLDQKDMDVIIYSSKNCYYCTSVKDLFKDKKIPYTEINVDNNPAKLKELEQKTGKKTVPQVIINGKHVGSYLDIVWGDVDALLKNPPSASNK